VSAPTNPPGRARGGLAGWSAATVWLVIALDLVSMLATPTVSSVWLRGGERT